MVWLELRRARTCLRTGMVVRGNQLITLVATAMLHVSPGLCSSLVEAPPALTQAKDACVSNAIASLDDHISDAKTIAEGVDFECYSLIDRLVKARVPPGDPELIAFKKAEAGKQVEHLLNLTKVLRYRNRQSPSVTVRE